MGCGKIFIDKILVISPGLLIKRGGGIGPMKPRQPSAWPVPIPAGPAQALEDEDFGLTRSSQSIERLFF
jgi:hypothetical protein